MTLTHEQTGDGGYDPTKPNSNVIERIVDNEDGTGTRIVYDDKGQQLGEPEPITGLYVEPAEVKIERTIRHAAAGALAANGTFLAIATPTDTRNAAQVKALTRQLNGLIRLAVGRFDATT